MENKEKWTKYTFVCDPDECDALVEFTARDGYYYPLGVVEMKCPCGRKMNWVSVVDATIYPTEKKEENMNGLTTENLPLSLAEQYNPNTLVTYKVITDGETTYVNDKVSDIEWTLHSIRRNQNLVNTYYNKEHSLRDIISEAYTDSQDQDTLLQIAKLFDIPLTKTIEYSATITVSGTMEVDLTDTYDINDMIFNHISIQGDSELEVSDFDIYSVEEF